LLAADVLRLHLLCSGSDVIAALYVLVDRQRAYAYIGGFDPEWSRYSPGVLLMAYAMARAVEAGCVHFDLLRGSEPYKYAWGAINRTTARVSRRGGVNAERL
jgi:CelD/BcsL family acetyltransferase involved in cellulose biosynthesis